MKIYINSKNEIKDVNSTTDTTLTELEINDEENPFANWSTAKICCFKAEVTDGIVTMMTPYIDSRIIEHIDALGKAHSVNADTISNLELALEEIYESMNSEE